MGVTRWLKTWGALLVGMIALGLSGYAVYTDNVHYQEVTKPHTQHDEIYDRLVRLDDKIERAEENINALQGVGQDINGPQENLRKARELRDQAELAWDKGSYTKADSLINKAFDILQEIPLSPASRAWWIWSIVGLVVVAVILVVAFMLRRRAY